MLVIGQHVRLRLGVRREVVGVAFYPTERGLGERPDIGDAEGFVERRGR